LNYRLIEVYDRYVVENKCEDKFAMMFYDDSLQKSSPQKVFAYTIMANIGLVWRNIEGYRETSLKTVMKSNWNLFDSVLTVLVDWFRRCEYDMYQVMPMNCNDIWE
jgi:hypothetical protein